MKKYIVTIILLFTMLFSLHCKKDKKDDKSMLGLLLLLRLSSSCNNPITCSLNNVTSNMKSGGVTAKNILPNINEFESREIYRTTLTNLSSSSCYTTASDTTGQYYSYNVFNTNNGSCYPGTTEPSYTNWLAYTIVYDGSSGLAPDLKINAPDGTRIRAEGLDFALQFVMVGLSELKSDISTPETVTGNNFFQKGESKSFTFQGKSRKRNSYYGASGDKIYAFSVTTGYSGDLNKHMLTRVIMDMKNKSIFIDYRGSTQNSLSQGAFRAIISNMEYSDSSVSSITGQEALNKNVYLVLGNNSTFTILDSTSSRRLYKAEGKWFQKFNARIITASSYGNKSSDICFNYGTGPSSFDVTTTFCSDLNSVSLTTASVSGFTDFELGIIGLDDTNRQQFIDYYKTRVITWQTVDDLTTSNMNTYGKN